MHYSDRIRQRLLDEQTPYERRLYAVLDELGAIYIPQYVISYGDTFMVVDCIIPEIGVVIELDGMQHVLDMEKCAEDCARDEYLLKAHDLKVIRYMNGVVFSDLFKKIIKELLNPLKQTKLTTSNLRVNSV